MGEDPLRIFRIILRIFAIPIDGQKDPWPWKVYNCVIIIWIFLALIGIIASSINQLNEDLLNSISAILFCVDGFCSYLCLTYTIYNGHNLLSIFKNISNGETNPIHRRPVHIDLIKESEAKRQILKFYSVKWLLIAAGIGCISYAFLFVAFGNRADTHFFDLGNNPGWRIGNILYLYVNAGWLLPMVIVRVGTHLLEERIFCFIEYLEDPDKDEQSPRQSSSLSMEISSTSNPRSCTLPPRVLVSIHSLTSSMAISQRTESTRSITVPPAFSDISIKQIMCWYDELYALNQTLSNALSLIIFQSILCLFPVVVFMLQVRVALLFLSLSVCLNMSVSLVFCLSFSSGLHPPRSRASTHNRSLLLGFHKFVNLVYYHRKRCPS
jgi:hypothetical protein